MEGYVVAATLQHFGMSCIDTEDPHSDNTAEVHQH